MVIKAKRVKKCKVCGDEYRPWNSTQKACSPRCALALVDKDKAKAERKKTRALKEKVKTRGELLDECQKAFNELIRLRDADKPCISCGRHHQGQWHAGHYRTTKAAPELRFDPRNCHKQCAPCNNHKSGDIVNYRVNLVERIGADEVADIEGSHAPKKWSKDEIRGMTKLFRHWARQIKRGQMHVP